MSQAPTGRAGSPLAELKACLAETARVVEGAWEAYLPPTTGPAGHIGQAVRHSLRGGKRLRPFVVRLAAETFGLRADAVTPTACAFELLHTATLIHDDLPAIDDAHMRRGQPSCHVTFDEPTAILAGDALIVASFAAISSQARCPDTSVEAVVRVVEEFAAAVQDVIAGEAADIVGEEKAPAADLLQFIHQHKTASLFVSAARAGAILAGATDDDLSSIAEYAGAVGLLFQITDDLLDVTGDTSEIGKPTGLDAAAGKQTYPAVYGLERARQEAERLAAHARGIAARLPRKAGLWLALVDLILDRRS